MVQINLLSSFDENLDDDDEENDIEEEANQKKSMIMIGMETIKSRKLRRERV